MTMDSGYIKINRKILEWEWYGNINTKVLFLHMLLKANWKDGKFEGKVIPKGSFVSSIPKLSLETSLTQREIRTAIEHLKSTGELTVKTTNKYSVFTVKNYCQYQDSDTQNDIQMTCETTGKRHSNDILTTTIEEKKEIKNINITVSKDTVCSEPKKPSESSVIEIPLNDKSLYPIYQSNVDEWKEWTRITRKI